MFFGSSIQQENEVCTGVTCTKTIGDMLVKYSGFVRIPDKAFNRTALKTVKVSGTEEEREKRCVDACVSEGIGSCKSAHIERYSSSKPESVCSLFQEDVYGEYPVEEAYMREELTGYVSIHLKVVVVV